MYSSTHDAKSAVCVLSCVDYVQNMDASASILQSLFQSPLRELKCARRLDFHSPIIRTQSAPAVFHPIQLNSNDLPVVNGDSGGSEERSSTPLFNGNRKSRHSNYSGGTRRTIVAYLQLGLTPIQIHSLTHMSVRTIRSITLKWNNERSVCDRVRTGRPSIVNSKTTQRIVEEAKTNPFVTPRIIKYNLNLSTISAKTIRRILNKNDLWPRIARVVPPFKPETIRKRLSFADGYSNWTTGQWSLVLWSDECSISLGTYGQVWVQRPIGDAFNPKYTVPREKHPPKVHMWGCMSMLGVGECYIFTENLDAILMKNILKNHLIASAKKLFGNKAFWFQQDNDPKHSSRLVKDWLFNNGIRCIEWPPYSPDLNPIENVWASLKRRIECRSPKNVDELAKIAKEEWMATKTDLCVKLVHSMHTRIKQVQQRSGHISDY